VNPYFVRDVVKEDVIHSGEKVTWLGVDITPHDYHPDYSAPGMVLPPPSDQNTRYDLFTEMETTAKTYLILDKLNSNRIERLLHQRPRLIKVLPHGSGETDYYILTLPEFLWLLYNYFMDMHRHKVLSYDMILRLLEYGFYKLPHSPEHIGFFL